MVTRRCEKDTLQRSHYHFSRKDVRAYTSWGDTQLKIHLGRLVDMEYLLLHRKGNRYDYELCYHGDSHEGNTFLMGLIDSHTLKNCTYDTKRSGLNGNRSGQNGDRSGVGRPSVGGMSGGGRSPKNAEKPLNNSVSGDLSLKTEKKDYIAKKKKAVSYVHDAP